MLPEYLFDNVAEYVEFLSRYNAEALDDADKDILITFTIVFLSPGYVNNPFMKAKLVHVCAPHPLARAERLTDQRVYQMVSFRKATGEKALCLTDSRCTRCRRSTSCPL